MSEVRSSSENLDNQQMYFPKVLVVTARHDIFCNAAPSVVLVAGCQILWRQIVHAHIPDDICCIRVLFSFRCSGTQTQTRTMHRHRHRSQLPGHRSPIARSRLSLKAKASQTATVTTKTPWPAPAPVHRTSRPDSQSIPGEHGSLGHRHTQTQTQTQIQTQM